MHMHGKAFAAELDVFMIGASLAATSFISMLAWPVFVSMLVHAAWRDCFGLHEFSLEYVLVWPHWHFCYLLFPRLLGISIGASVFQLLAL